jgi:hypothetical protein
MKRMIGAGALAGGIALAALAATDEAAADKPPPYIPGWVRPSDLPPDEAPEVAPAPAQGGFPCYAYSPPPYSPPPAPR